MIIVYVPGGKKARQTETENREQDRKKVENTKIPIQRIEDILS